MTEQETIAYLNTVYKRLDAKRKELADALRSSPFPLRTGYYNGHYNQSPDGTYVMDYYPIPVIDVRGLCDIEIHLDRLSVATKLHRADALAYSFAPLQAYPFEAYGVEAFLETYRQSGGSITDMKNAIRQSSEQEIGFSFSFPFDTSGDALLAFTQLLTREKFHY